MKASPLLVLFAASFAWFPSGALAQTPATPPPTLSSPYACSAHIRVDWDVRSIPGADGLRWRIRKGAPGALISATTLVDSDDALGATGFIARNLRNFGPVLDGTRCFVRA